ncbi:MAG TPA: PDZ domain-containing protein [Acidobacteriota bacterium]|nr:PDZ domain-containing protein [Acidobacteriota bacterium]
MTFLLAVFLTVLPFHAEIETQAIHYEVSIPQPQTHMFEVRIEVGGLGLGEVDLSMPVWTPGSYLVREYERHVVRFAAENGAGDPLAWRKLDKNTWRVQTGGAAKVVAKYEVYGREPGIRWSFVYDEGGHVIGPSLLMHPVGYADLPATVRFNLPEGWKLDGGIAPAAEDPFLISARSYHDLIDTPMMIGNFESVEFEVDGVAHLIAVLGPTDADLEKLSADVKKLVETNRDLFGELPYERYVFAWMTIEHGGGIEHANGTSLGMGGWGFDDEERYKGFLGVVAHEHFHAWNVKRIQPPAFRPYGYEEENYTDALWWYEGVTSYYNERMLLRAGYEDYEGYLKDLAGQIDRYRTTPGRELQSAADSSYDAWVKAYRGDENSENVQISYYNKGAIVGLLLDLEIAKQTGGKKGLDDVVRLMWERTHDEGAAFGTNDIRAVCEEVAGGSFDEIFDKYVYGTAEVPFEDYLGYAGYELKAEQEEEKEGEDKEKPKGFLGASSRVSNGRLTVLRVVRGAPAWLGGLNFGDEMLAINGFRIPDYDAFIQQLGRYGPGETLEILISRHGKIRTLEVTLGERPYREYKIEEVGEPSEAQTAVREKWLPKPPASEDAEES